MQLKNYSHEKMRDGDRTAAQLVLCSTALVLRQDSGVHWAGIAGDERVKIIMSNMAADYWFYRFKQLQQHESPYY